MGQRFIEKFQTTIHEAKKWFRGLNKNLKKNCYEWKAVATAAAGSVVQDVRPLSLWEEEASGGPAPTKPRRKSRVIPLLNEFNLLHQEGVLPGVTVVGGLWGQNPGHAGPQGSGSGSFPWAQWLPISLRFYPTHFGEVSGCPGWQGGRCTGFAFSRHLVPSCFSLDNFRKSGPHSPEPVVDIEAQSEPCGWQGLGAPAGCQAWDSEVGDLSSGHWTTRDLLAWCNINQQEFSQRSPSQP